MVVAALGDDADDSGLAAAWLSDAPAIVVVRSGGVCCVVSWCWFGMMMLVGSQRRRRNVVNDVRREKVERKREREREGAPLYIGSGTTGRAASGR